jgi:hypothetical protein
LTQRLNWLPISWLIICWLLPICRLSISWLILLSSPFF